ncbi:MAG: hypothetical protein LUI85_01405 [Bacteroides sp.]|nr:hypothetical protein [Bacteroides sp.]
MDNTLKLTESYWEMLKSLSDEVKLRLATRLTASVIEGKANSADKTEEMLRKHFNVWKDDRSAERIIEDLYASRQSSKAPLNFD